MFTHPAEQTLQVIDIIDGYIFHKVIKRGKQDKEEGLGWRGQIINLLCHLGREIQHLLVSPSYAPKMFFTDPKQKAGHSILQQQSQF